MRKTRHRRNPAICLDHEYFVREGDRYGDEANLFLPLSNDGQRVNMVIVFKAYRRL